ncbi:MAG: ATP synthase subunit I [Desulfohalobiaceae bacterium]
MKPRTRTSRIDVALRRGGLQNPEIRWIVKFQLYQVAFCVLLLLLLQARVLPGFVTGALLVTLNLYFLANMVPRVLQEGSGGSFLLVLSFYLRLALAAVILALCIVWAEFSLPSLIAGLSTMVVSIIAWSARFYWMQKNKEA